ncbi:hypothetical protein BRAS3843_2630010 [Bradyrhizobium sp. STM 3843]|nr:hypothetical protein BRAS3843_2630010 [Bradyrhizobium sp. STM 3843]
MTVLSWGLAAILSQKRHYSATFKVCSYLQRFNSIWLVPS